MSCRHNLGLGNCKVCYPESGTIQPDNDGEGLDGPMAVGRDGVKLPVPPVVKAMLELEKLPKP
jgi:hypothetical protein